MGAPTSVVTASGHQLSKDHKKGKAKKPTPARVTSKGQTDHGETTTVISCGLPGLVPIGSTISQSFSTGNAGREPAVKRKAASNGPRESLPGTEAKRPPRPRKKAAGTSPASSRLGLSGQITKDLTSGPPVNAPGQGGVPVSSGLNGIPTTLQAACISAAMSMPAQDPHGMLPKVSEAAPGLVIPELCAQVREKSVALDATRCENCSSPRCNGPEKGTNRLASDKLKLRLFPLDDHIKEGFEQEGRNPHLELTLKARKSISSVVHHLAQKWGRSTVASGELRVFPVNTKWSNMSACQSWGFQDINVSAADVHAALGSPAVFRLRYAWLPSRILQTSSAVLQQRELPASNKSEPVLPETSCHPTRIDSITHHTSVLSQASIPRNVRVANSTVMSTDPCRPAEQIPPLPVLDNACRSEDGKQSAVPSNTILGVDAQHAVESPGIAFKQPAVAKSRLAKKASPVGAGLQSEKASVPPALDVAVPPNNILRVDARNTAFKQPVLGKSRRAKKAPAVAAALQSEEGLVSPALVGVTFARKDSENADQSKCKGLENTNQASDFVWLCENSDGFAQQLWNCEDTFRSICGPSISQMEWVNSLPDLTASQLLGEASRAVSSAALDNFQPSSGQTQLNCVDSIDIEMGGPEPARPPSTNLSAAIICGEDTCDAFSFQRMDEQSKDIANSVCEEFSGTGFDSTFSDVQDLLFDREVSTGLGGLLAALAQESLDEFQASTVSNDAAVRDLDKQVRFHDEVSGRTREASAEADTELPAEFLNDAAVRDLDKEVRFHDAVFGQTRESNAETGTELHAELLELLRTDELTDGYSEPIRPSERLPEATLPGVNTPSQDVEPLKASITLSMRNKERFPPQRLFMLPGQYTPA